jgi:hypothetical protein
MPDDRLAHLKRFYWLLDKLAASHGESPALGACNGRMSWPDRGIYFFFEDGETRCRSGSGRRVVRVGTHALKAGSRTRLWSRLSQHRGTIKNGGGNHRGSIFRLHVGSALLHHDGQIECRSWGVGQTASGELRMQERKLETMVSQIIGGMTFIWMKVEDEPGPQSKRGYFERNAIALLSNYRKPSFDAPSELWLGQYCASERCGTPGSGIQIT